MCSCTRTLMIKDMREMLVETKKVAYRLGIQDNYTHKNPLMRWIFWKRLQIILEMVKKASNLDSVLDFGMGWGVLLPSLSRIFKRVYGVEINRVKIARALHLVRLLNCKNIWIYEVEPHDKLLVFKDKSMDCIIAADVLEHIPNLRDTLQSLKRILKDDGWLIVSIPTENLLYKFAQKLMRIPAWKSQHVHNAKTVIETLKKKILQSKNNIIYFSSLRSCAVRLVLSNKRALFV